VKIFIRLAVLAAALCLTLTACGGGGSTPAASGSGGAVPSPTASASSSGSAALSAFDTCLKSHGVKTTFKPRAFPSGSARPTARPTAFPTAHRSPGAGGFGGFATNSADAAAFKACQKYAPTGFGRGSGGFGGGSVSASALAAFKSCMTQNGVTVTGSTVQAIFSQLRTATGKTATAFKTCRVLIQSSATPSPSPSA
jgi:hypothetical protein